MDTRDFIDSDDWIEAMEKDGVNLDTFLEDLISHMMMIEFKRGMDYQKSMNKRIEK